MKNLPFGGCPEVMYVFAFFGILLVMCIAAPIKAIVDMFDDSPPPKKVEVKREKRIKKVWDWLNEEVE